MIASLTRAEGMRARCRATVACWQPADAGWQPPLPPHGHRSVVRCAQLHVWRVRVCVCGRHGDARQRSHLPNGAPLLPLALRGSSAQASLFIRALAAAKAGWTSCRLAGTGHMAGRVGRLLRRGAATPQRRHHPASGRPWQGGSDVAAVRAPPVALATAAGAAATASGYPAPARHHPLGEHAVRWRVRGARKSKRAGMLACN